MTHTDPDTPKHNARRWLKPLLFVSLALNLLIVGVVAGSMLSPDGPRKRGGDDRAVRGVLGEPFFRALPEAQRRAMLRDIVGQRDKFHQGREALRERVVGLLAALRSDTFDRAEVERLLAEQRQAAVQRQNMGEALLLDRLEAMTPDERAAYADALESKLKGLRRR